MRETTVSRKRMEKQHEEELEKEQSLKKNVERKVSSTHQLTDLQQYVDIQVCYTLLSLWLPVVLTSTCIAISLKELFLDKKCGKEGKFPSFPRFNLC